MITPFGFHSRTHKGFPYISSKAQITTSRIDCFIDGNHIGATLLELCLKQDGAYNLSTSSTVDKTVNSQHSDMNFGRYVRQTLVCS